MLTGDWMPFILVNPRDPDESGLTLALQTDCSFKLLKMSKNYVIILFKTGEKKLVISVSLSLLNMKSIRKHHHNTESCLYSINIFCDIFAYYTGIYLTPKLWKYHALPPFTYRELSNEFQLICTHPDLLICPILYFR